MATTPTPKPPLPFGGSTFEGANTLLSTELLVQKGAVTDITNLVGERIREQLTIRGDIGYPPPGLAEKVVNRVRNPWVLTCQKWIEGGRYIIATVNPKDVQWRMPQRSAVQKTRVGEILHVWKDTVRNTFYDEPTIQITFQSGNIMPIRNNPLVTTDEQQKLGRVNETRGESVRGGVGSDQGRGLLQTSRLVTRPKREPDFGEITRIPDGLENFYEFLQLVDEQKILDGGDINFVYIIYNSRIFPSITLAGLFTPEGVSWTDSSDDPNQVNSWSANFTIYDSYPRLNDLNALTQFFESAGFGRV